MARFPRNQARQHITAARNSHDPGVRGKALEELACVLFTSIPGILAPIRNAVDIADGGEIDIFLSNRGLVRGLWFLPISILVEYKNWGGRVGAQEVRTFIDRLRERAVTTGILIAANGVTGDAANLTAAHHQIARALEGKKHVLVITLEDLERVRSGKQLVDLVLTKWTRLHTFLTSI